MDEIGSLHQGKGGLISEFFAFVVSSKKCTKPLPSIFSFEKARTENKFPLQSQKKTILLIFLFKLLSVELFSNHGNGFQVFSRSARPVGIYGDGWNLPQLTCKAKWLQFEPFLGEKGATAIFSTNYRQKTYGGGWNLSQQTCKENWLQSKPFWEKSGHYNSIFHMDCK